MLECCFAVEEDGDDGDGSGTLWETSSIRLSASWRCFGCLRRSHEGVEMRSLLGAAGISSQQQLKNSQLAYD